MKNAYQVPLPQVLHFMFICMISPSDCLHNFFSFLLYLCPDLQFLLQLKFFTTLGWSSFSKMLSSYFQKVNSPEIEPEKLLLTTIAATLPLPFTSRKRTKDSWRMSPTRMIGLPNFNNEGRIQSLAVNSGLYNPYEEGYVLS